jgi:hypothetical protein
MRKDDPMQVNDAYVMAADFVGWFVEQYGNQALRAMLVEVGKGASVDRAAKKAIKHPLRKLEKLWRDSFETKS